MKKVLLIAVAILAALPLSAAKSKGPASIKVISYNIRMGTAGDGPNSWEFRAPASSIMINDQDPDIFGLQEAFSFQAEYLKQSFTKYKYIGVGRDDGKKKGEIMAIFYNRKRIALKKWGTWWLSDTPETPSKGWDAACYRTATWALMKDKRSGRLFWYVNTHLDHKGHEARAKGLSLIMDKIAEMNAEKNLPLILTGDFNMKYSDPSMSEVLVRMKDARETAAVTDHHDTYNAWGKRSALIDYIFYTGFSSCTEYHTITKSYFGRTFISDHFPISAVLVF